MKRDEPFDPIIKSRNFPEALVFRLATREDCHSINTLMFERNPSQRLSVIETGTSQEIDRVESGGSYKLYVAELNNEVIGFCRFAHSGDLPANKKIFQSPEGWFGLGILVSPKFRRQNIANFLSTKRIEVLRELNVKEFYSVVDTRNLTSMKMHQNFGYVEVARDIGFLHISFEGAIGCLFRLSI